MSELLDRILSRDNMNLAYKRVRANKGAGGIDDVEVDELYSYINRRMPNGTYGGVKWRR